MRGMRFQFSILTMLVCTAALACVIAVCVREPVWEVVDLQDGQPISGPYINPYQVIYTLYPPAVKDIARRLAWAGPLAVFASLWLLWASRRIVKREKRSGPITEITQHPLS